MASEQQLDDPWGDGDLMRTRTGGVADINDFYETFTGYTHVCRICGALVAHHARKRHRGFHGNPDGPGRECPSCHTTQGCMCADEPLPDDGCGGDPWVAIPASPSDRTL